MRQPINVKFAIRVGATTARYVAALVYNFIIPVVDLVWENSVAVVRTYHEIARVVNSWFDVVVGT